MFESADCAPVTIMDHSVLYVKYLLMIHIQTQLLCATSFVNQPVVPKSLAHVELRMRCAAMGSRLRSNRHKNITVVT